MPNRIQLPEAYVVAVSSIADRGHWVGELLRVCARGANGADSIEIIDERQSSDDGDMAGVVFKVSGQLPVDIFQKLSREIQLSCPVGVNVQLFKAVRPAEFSLLVEDLSIEYFRREFAVNSRMVHHTDNCVKLTHRTTGKSVRSTAHRSRVLNYEEALLLLESTAKSVVYEGHNPAFQRTACGSR